MAYEIEFDLPVGQPFNPIFEIVSLRSGQLVRSDYIDHQLAIYPYEGYAPWWNGPCVAYASNANGLITELEPGVLAVNIPAGQLNYGSWCGGPSGRYQSSRFRLVASANNILSVLAFGTVTFGGY